MHVNDFQSLNVNLDNYDLVLVADGSGTTSWKPCGWAVAIYRPVDNVGLWASGGNTGATNNYAELEPFLYGLWRAGRDWECKKWKRILCITDSQITAMGGNGIWARAANEPLWAQLKWYEEQGIKFEWLWVRRNSNPLNKWADETAGKMRLSIVGLMEELNAGSAEVST